MGTNGFNIECALDNGDIIFSVDVVCLQLQCMLAGRQFSKVQTSIDDRAAQVNGGCVGLRIHKMLPVQISVDDGDGVCRGDSANQRMRFFGQTLIFGRGSDFTGDFLVEVFYEL